MSENKAELTLKARFKVGPVEITVDKPHPDFYVEQNKADGLLAENIRLRRRVEELEAELKQLKGG